MLTKRRYGLNEVLSWTRYELLFLITYNLIILAIAHTMELSFLQVPWTPIGLLGTAVAFLIGFQANSSYDRIWEARKIWGGIVNTSRTWGMMVRDMVSNEHAQEQLSEEELKGIHLELVKRHVAWLTALRYAMREKRQWEEFHRYKTNREFSNQMYIPEKEEAFEDVVQNYISPKEWNEIKNKGNKPTSLLYLQSKHIKELKDKGLLWEFSFLELEKVLETLFDLQGKSERIKNFPYPKQFSSISFYLVMIFAIFLPFGLLPIFDNIAEELSKFNPKWHYFVWSMAPFSAIIAWSLWLIQRVSMVGENPFEGTGNDVPISAISRGIEIDMLQQYDLDPMDIPKPFPTPADVQM